MNSLTCLLSVIIISTLLVFSPLTHAASAFDRSLEATQERDAERLFAIDAISRFLDQYYLNYREYPKSKTEFIKAFRDYSYGDATIFDDPLLPKRWAMFECKRGYSYEVYADSYGNKNGAYRVSACTEGNTQWSTLANEDGGISPKKYEIWYQIDKKQRNTKKFYLSSDWLTETILGNSQKPVVPLYKTLNQEQFTSLRKNSYLEWDPSAKFTVIEYSDFECSYCIQHRQDGVIAELKKKYGSDGDFIFKPVNLAGHQGSDAKGFAALCVAKIWGVKKYQEFYGKIMDQSSATGAMFPVENLSSLAQDTGIDMQNFEACVSKEETVSMYLNYAKEAYSLRLGGTPTTIIINNTTREYEFIEGAHRIDKFEKVIDGLLKR